MSNAMLLGVLRMPIPDNPAPLTLRQFVDRARQAAAEIERLTDDYAAATHLLADRDAHIERLKAELATLRASAASVQADQRAEIDAANAALRADAERLTAIELNGWIVERDIEGEWAIAAQRRYGEPIRKGEGMTLRAAIDAARALRKGTT